MANYKQLANSKIQFTATLQKDALEAVQKEVIENLKGEVSIKGFRKGQAPDEMVIGAIGPQRISEESLNRALDKLFWDFIETEQLRVVNRPEVDMSTKEEWPLDVTFVVEIYPEIKLGDYTKVKVSPEPVKIEDKDIDEVLETLCAQAQIASLVDRAAQDRDLLTVDFVGKDKSGNILPNTEGKGQTFRVGMGHFLPDLEKAFMKMKAGDSKHKVKVKFPKDYHANHMAGQTVLFDITLHEVKAIDPSKLTETQIEQIMGQKMDLPALRTQIRTTVTQNKTKEHQQNAVRSYEEGILKYVTADIPQSWIDEEVNNRLERMKQNPQYQMNPEAFWGQIGKSEEAFRKDIAIEATKSLKVFLGLSTIIEKEGITLSPDELKEIDMMVAAQLERTPEANPQILKDKIILNRKIDKHLQAAVLSA